MKTLTAIIPVYNEEVYIHRCLENVLAVKLKGYELEVIIMDDGSTDNSLAIARTFESQPNVHVFSKSRNQGKGAVILEGLQYATGDVIIIQDADLEYDPDDYSEILKKYADPQVDAVYGSRILGATLFHHHNSNYLFYLGGRLLTACVNIAFGTELTDQPTGYKSWRSTLNKHIVRNCKQPGFDFEIELTWLLSRLTTILEVPTHYYPRSPGHGKKITFFDFLLSLKMIVSCRLRALV